MIFGIICGGFSSEYDISVKSARNIQQFLPDHITSHLIFLNENGWRIELDGKTQDFNHSDFTYTKDETQCKIDCAIVYIHGDPGENGKLQAYLDIIKIPYINSGPLASQLSFDKWYCNQFLKGFGLNVAHSIYLNDKNNWPESELIANELKLPLFVKPCDSGSSFGIAKVAHIQDIDKAISDAFQEGETVILESFLDGIEVTCGVYRSTEGIQALPLTEIVTNNDFFDFQAKYNGESEEITPARIDSAITEEIQELSKYIYSLLKLRSIARIDYMIVMNEVYIIEVNTTPGFSNESIVPKMIENSDLSITQVWSEIVKAELNTNT